MKKHVRVMVVMLVLVMALSACQPTPESEPVVNKGDRVLEEKISATAPTQNPTEVEGEAEATTAPVFQYTFPDRWEEVYDAGNELVLTFNADIIQKADGVYPVYRTKAGTVDAETVQTVLNTLLPAPVSMHETGMTKDDWKAEMEQYVKDMEEHQARLRLPPEERGDGDDTEISQEEIDEKFKWYAEQMALAPETLNPVPTTEFSGLRERTGIVYELSNGEKAYVRYGSNFWLISRSSSQTGTVLPSYDRWEYEDDGVVWKDVTITEEEALAQGQEVIDKLGFEGFALVEVYEANYAGDENWRRPTSSGYVMKYKRSFGGYPLVTCVEPAQYFNYGDGDGFVANKYIYEEYVDAYVDESGVRHIEYSGAKEVMKQENASVELLDFETVQERIRKGLTYGLTGKFESAEVYKLVLTVNTQRVAGSDEYYEVPCWIVYYDANDYSYYKTEEEIQTVKERVRSPHFVMVDALYINAIDGTVVHTDW